jgi:hypothetical protein
LERFGLKHLAVSHKWLLPTALQTTQGLILVVHIIVIALWLGHESTQRTHGHVEADLAIKEKALEERRPQVKKHDEVAFDGAPTTGSALPPVLDPEPDRHPIPR